VLAASDGLDGPTSIVVDGRRAYVASAGYNTGMNPNILEIELER
jgi:hypothetical protein